MSIDTWQYDDTPRSEYNETHDELPHTSTRDVSNFGMFVPQHPCNFKLVRCFKKFLLSLNQHLATSEKH